MDARARRLHRTTPTRDRDQAKASSSKQTGPSSSSSATCFRRGKPGHWARDCTEAPKKRQHLDEGHNGRRSLLAPVSSYARALVVEPKDATWELSPVSGCALNMERGEAGPGRDDDAANDADARSPPEIAPSCTRVARAAAVVNVVVRRGGGGKSRVKRRVLMTGKAFARRNHFGSRSPSLPTSICMRSGNPLQRPSTSCVAVI